LAKRRQAPRPADHPPPNKQGPAVNAPAFVDRDAVRRAASDFDRAALRMESARNEAAAPWEQCVRLRAGGLSAGRALAMAVQAETLFIAPEFLWRHTGGLGRRLSDENALHFWDDACRQMLLYDPNTTEVDAALLTNRRDFIGESMVQLACVVR
jgi:hypothetical protein